jgi:mannosyl-3-phosphoglycerate phosphatase family protein
VVTSASYRAGAVNQTPEGVFHALRAQNTGSTGCDSLSRRAIVQGVRAEKPDLPLVVFSDVDGVLTEPRASTSAAATGALEPLARAHIPVVLCSSRTRAELEVVRQELGITDPFICEGGGALVIPRGYFHGVVPGGRDHTGYQAVEFGQAYATVVATVRRTAQRMGIEIVGFNDMSIEQVARECEIPLLRARLAKLREYQEPFRVIDPEPSVRDRLIKALHAARLRCVRRGRYDHAGALVDTSVAAKLLCALYRRAYGPIRTIGIFDRTADAKLKQLVDHPVLVEDDDCIEGAVSQLEWAEKIVAKAQEVADVSPSSSGIAARRE